jgi:hypothetical protein
MASDVDLTAIGALVSGGGSVVLAAIVWLQQRDIGKTLLAMNKLLGRIAEQHDVKDEPDR